jgi:hypothetical protein
VKRAVSLVVLLVLLVSPSARAENECINAYEQTQSLRKDGKLLASKERAQICARAECPAILSKDCTKWTAELEASIPTVVFDAHSPKYVQLVDVRVKENGQAIAERIDGKAVHLDPGEHKFVFEMDGAEPVEKIVVVKEGEKNRRVNVVLSPTSEPTSATTPHAEGDRPIPLGVWIFGGASAVALVAATVLAIDGLAKKGDLDDCKPHCAPDDVDSMTTRFTFADVALGAGVMAGAAAAYLYLTRPALTEPKSARVRPWIGPGGAGVGGSF